MLRVTKGRRGRAGGRAGGREGHAWRTSSLLGARMMAWGHVFSLSIKARVPMTKAALFPLPELA